MSTVSSVTALMLSIGSRCASTQASIAGKRGGQGEGEIAHLLATSGSRFSLQGVLVAGVVRHSRLLGKASHKVRQVTSTRVSPNRPGDALSQPCAEGAAFREHIKPFLWPRADWSVVLVTGTATGTRMTCRVPSG